MAHLIVLPDPQNERPPKAVGPFDDEKRAESHLRLNSWRSVEGTNDKVWAQKTVVRGRQAERIAFVVPLEDQDWYLKRTDEPIF